MTRKLKILFTIPNFDTAGSGRVLFDLADGLDKSLFDISIACNHSRGDFFQVVASLGIPIHLINFSVPYRPYLSLFSRTKHFRKFVKEHKFDIVHSWNWSSDWTEGLSVRLAGAKYVYTKKAMGWGNVHWKLKSLFSNRVIVINKEMRAYYPKSKCVLIPLGIDTEHFRPTAIEKSNTSPIFNIITVANLVEVKGVELLILALANLKVPDIHLTIVGGGEQEYIDSLHKLVANYHLNSRVTFYEKQLDVRPFLESSDLYIIPTLNKGRKEGMPIALIEAMAMGLPVLGSNISGINFVLEDFKDLLFEPSNLEQLCQKISYIHSMSLQQRLELGHTLRHYCVKHFTLHNFISEHTEFYLNLLKKH